MRRAQESRFSGNTPCRILPPHSLRCASGFTPQHQQLRLPAGHDADRNTSLRMRRMVQFLGKSQISCQNRSFHDAALILLRPTRYRKPAHFADASGVTQSIFDGSSRIFWIDAPSTFARVPSR